MERRINRNPFTKMFEVSERDVSKADKAWRLVFESDNMRDLNAFLSTK